MLPETFFADLLIIIINAGKLKCKNYSIADLGFSGTHTSQIQDFFSTSVQFQDFSGPKKSKLKFQNFSGPVGTLLSASNANNIMGKPHR